MYPITVIPGFSVLGFRALPRFRAPNTGNQIWFYDIDLLGFSTLPGFKAPFYGDGQSALNPGSTELAFFARKFLSAALRRKIKTKSIREFFANTFLQSANSHALIYMCGHLPPSITPLATALFGGISTHADKMRSNPSSGIDNAVKPFG